MQIHTSNRNKECKKEERSYLTTLNYQRNLLYKRPSISVLDVVFVFCFVS